MKKFGITLMSLCLFANVQGQMGSFAKVEVTNKVASHNLIPDSDVKRIVLNDAIYEIRPIDKMRKFLEIVAYRNGNEVAEVYKLDGNFLPNEQNVIPADLTRIGNSLWLQLRVEEGEISKYYFQQLNPNDLTAIGKPRFIAQSECYFKYFNYAYFKTESINVFNSDNGNFFAVAILNRNEEDLYEITYKLFDRDFELLHKYKRKTGIEYRAKRHTKFLSPDIYVSNKGRLVDVYHRSEDDYQNPVIMIYYKGELEEYVVECNECKHLTYNMFDGEKVIFAGSSRGGQESTAEMGFTEVDLEANPNERIVTNVAYPFVFELFSKHMEKKAFDRANKEYAKNGYSNLLIASNGFRVEGNSIYFLFQRYSRYTDYTYTMEALIAFQFTIGEEIPRVRYLPIQNQSTGTENVDWFVRDGNVYVFHIAETSTVPIRYKYSEIPKKVAHYSSKKSFCLSELSFEDDSRYSNVEISNSSEFKKAFPHPEDIYFLNQEKTKFVVLAYKIGGGGKSSTEFQFHQIEFKE